MVTRSVSISMSAETLHLLMNHGYRLYVFKAVYAALSGTAGRGVPLIWYTIPRFFPRTTVTWNDGFSAELRAYTAKSTIVPEGWIMPWYIERVVLGWTLLVQQSNGSGRAVSRGEPGAITILNETTEEFTAGIGQATEQGPGLVCAFPLYGAMRDVVVPVERVLLMFSTEVFYPGTVILQAFAPGFFVNVSGVTSREVSFDVLTGWSAGGAPWARHVPGGADIKSLLVNNIPPR